MNNRYQRAFFQMAGLLLLMSGLAQGQEVKDIYRQADLAFFCSPPSTSHCCGAPGERECGYIINSSKPLGPGCTDPNGNILRDGLCKLDTAPVQPITPVNASQSALTFYLVSDLHLLRGGFHFDTQASFPSVLNYLATHNLPWPTGAGLPPGDTIDKPLGILTAGDLTANGSDNQLDPFRLLWEPNNSTRAINYPVYPILGNHDVVNAGNGGSASPGTADSMWRYIKTRMSPLNVDNSSTGQLDVDDGQGSHNYSYDWNNVHFVMLNTWAGDQNFLDAPTSDGLTWLKNDLARSVGANQRPVVVVQHYGLESVGNNLPPTDQFSGDVWQQWWSVDNFNSFWNVIRDYNVIAMFSGHRHSLNILRPEQMVDTALRAGGQEVPVVFTNDSAGNPKILDDFMIGHGGGCEDDDCTYGSAHFLAARITGNYLDVAPMEWFSTSNNYSPAPESGMNLYGDATVCRKRINSRYLNVSDAVSKYTTTADYCTTNCTVTGTLSNTSGVDIGGTLAIRVNATFANGNFTANGGVTNRDFVDSCSKYYGNAYVLLNSVPPVSGAPVNFTVNIAHAQGTGITFDLVRLINLGDPTPIDVSPAVITQASTTVTRTPLTVNFFDKRTSAFTTSIKFNSGNGDWIKVEQTGYNAGKGTLSITFSTSLISGLTAGSWEADVILTGANGDTATIPVFVTATQSLTYSAKAIDLTAFDQNLLTVTSPNLFGAVQVSNVAGPDFSVTPIFFQTPAQLTFKPTIGLLPGTYSDFLTVDYFGGSDHIPVAVQMQSVIVDTVPRNLPVTVDNVHYTSPATFTWQTSSLHTVSVDSSIQLDSQNQIQFNSWSMAGTLPSATVNTPPYNTQPSRYVATFDPYYRLTLNGNSHGTLTATPAAPGNFYKAGSSVSIQATSSDNMLQSFSGALTGSANPQLLTINGPTTVGANFVKTPNSAQFTFNTSPAGQPIQVDGVSYGTPVTFQWTASPSHTVSFPGQIYDVGTQYGFQSWNDGNTSAIRQFTGGSSGTFQYTANLVTQYQVSITTVPSASGVISGAGWVTAGTPTTLLAASAPGFSFVSFAGLPAGSTGNPVLVTQPLAITANFAPVKGTTLYATAGARTTPSAFLPDQRNVPITLVNSGAGAAGDVILTAIDTFVNLSGTEGDQVQVTSTLPVPLGTLLPGGSATANLLIGWPVSATRVQMRVHFTANEGTYSGYTVLNLFR